MTVSSAASASSAASSAAAATSSSGVLGSLSTFLQILTTQLTNQDPTDATDTNQFTEELVQFAQVEQQLNTNSDLTELVNLQKTSGGLTSTLNYIGQYAEVTTTSNQIALQSSTAELGYDLNSTAQSVSVQVSDSSGAVVATLTGTGTAGLNYVTWDGTNSSGTVEPDGTYTYKLVALNTDGTTQTPANTVTIGKVTGVTTNTDGTFNLSIGDISVSSTSVDAIYSATSLPTSTKASGS